MCISWSPRLGSYYNFAWWEMCRYSHSYYTQTLGQHIISVVQCTRGRLSRPLNYAYDCAAIIYYSRAVHFFELAKSAATIRGQLLFRVWLLFK